MCTCIEDLNENLAETNHKLSLATHKSGRQDVVIAIEKIDKKLPEIDAFIILPSFCPFCGEEYPLDPGESLISPKPDNHLN